MNWEAPLPNVDDLVRFTQEEREMFDANNRIEAHRVAALVFALVAGISAVTTAIAPAIVNL